MKVKDMRKKSAADLQKHADKLQVKLAAHNRDRYVKDVSNVKENSEIKREIARTLTILREYELTQKEED